MKGVQSEDPYQQKMFETYRAEHNKPNPDGTQDARRPSLMSLLAKLGLGAAALAPFIGPLARGTSAIGKMYQAGGLKDVGAGVANVAGKAVGGITSNPGGVARNIGSTYKDYYGTQLDKARKYFGM